MESYNNLKSNSNEIGIITINYPVTSSETFSRELDYLINDKNLIETVYIPSDNHATLCISSQVGCTLNCKFCHTGIQPLVKNLSAHEIINQVIL